MRPWNYHPSMRQGAEYLSCFFAALNFAWVGGTGGVVLEVLPRGCAAGGPAGPRRRL